MTRAFSIEILTTEDGLYLAKCAELCVSALGATSSEAQEACLRLVHESTVQTDSPPGAVESNRDTRLDDEEER